MLRRVPRRQHRRCDDPGPPVRGPVRAGIVVVATSNCAARPALREGLNRDRFLPFIELLQARLDVVALDGPTDYRLVRLRDLAIYLHPLGPATDAQARAVFAALTDGAPGAAETMAVGSRRARGAAGRQGRGLVRLRRPVRAAAGCRRLSGAGRPLPHRAPVTGVPRLTPDRRNEARRFMTLVDALYERRIDAGVTAEARRTRSMPPATAPSSSSAPSAGCGDAEQAYFESPPSPPRTGGTSSRSRSPAI